MFKRHSFRNNLLGFLLVVCTASSVAHARTCEKLLRRSGRNVPVTDFQFAEGAADKLKSFDLDQARFLHLMKVRPNIPLAENETDFWMIVFEPNPRLGDRGIKVVGHREGSTYVIDRVGRSQHWDERNYFQQVAELTGVGPRMFNLRHGIFNCHNIMVYASTQVKLWLKHRLRPEDVIAFVDRPDLRPVSDGHENSVHERYHFAAPDKKGHSFRAIVEVKPDCDHHLVTAFEDR